jgi:hypothetical protein
MAFPRWSLRRGQTNTVLTITDMTTNDTYEPQVSNPYGTNTSSVVVVNVVATPAPAINRVTILGCQPDLRGLNNSFTQHCDPLYYLPTMKLFFALTYLLISLTLCRAEMQNPIPLWPDGAPGALGTNDWDIPTVTPYLPEPGSATGAAMVICPGGGYAHLAPHEGNDYALWLNQHGVTCFVLKYRLGSNGYHHPAMLQDAARAVRWVRANADDYKIDTHRVGIMGSSAGGHLASTLMTHFDGGDTNATDVIERQSSHPDLGILCYAVISLGKFAHQGSKVNGIMHLT